MLFPLVICSHNRLVIAPVGWFDGIGSLDIERHSLRLNLSSLGQHGLSWFLDADGLFYRLDWLRLEPITALQALRISRRVESYSVAPPEPIQVAKLLSLTSSLVEQFEEAPNAAELRALLGKREPHETVGPEFMREYLAL